MIRWYLILTSCCDSFLWCICAEHSDLFRFPFGLSHLFLYWWWLPVAHVHNIRYLYFVSLHDTSTWQGTHFWQWSCHWWPLSMIYMFTIACYCWTSLSVAYMFVIVLLLLGFSLWHLSLTVALLLMCLSLHEILSLPYYCLAFAMTYMLDNGLDTDGSPSMIHMFVITLLTSCPLVMICMYMCYTLSLFGPTSWHIYAWQEPYFCLISYHDIHII